MSNGRDMSYGQTAYEANPIAMHCDRCGCDSVMADRGDHYECEREIVVVAPLHQEPNYHPPPPGHIPAKLHHETRHTCGNRVWKVRLAFTMKDTTT